MCEVTFRHKVVCLNDTVNVMFVDAHSDTHDHMLRTFGNTAVDPEKVRPLQSLETKAGESMR